MKTLAKTYSALVNPQKLGMILGLACAVHCSLMPFLLAALPAISGTLFDSLLAEAAVIGSSLALGYYFILRGYFKHNTGFTPVILLTIGAFLIVFPHLLPVHIHWLEWVMAPFGGIAIAGAQYLNYKASHTHTHTCQH